MYIMLNKYLSQKLKLIGMSEFNPLINIPSCPLSSNSPSNLIHEIFNRNRRQIKKLGFELKITALVSCYIIPYPKSLNREELGNLII